MKVNTISGEPATIECDTLVVGLFEDATPPVTETVDAALDKVINSLVDDKKFKPEMGQAKSITTLGKITPKNVLVIGLGKKEKATLETIRKAAALSAKALRDTNAKTVATTLHQIDIDDPTARAQAVTEASIVSTYQFNEYKTEKEGIKELDTVSLVCTDEDLSNAEPGVKKGIIVADATNFVRDLVNQPPSVATPAYMAAQAEAVAKELGFKCTIFKRDQLKEMGCNGILAVGQASDKEQHMAILEYGEGDAPTALVGKGITFDSGGLNIKPTRYIETMKCDMAGAATVLGIFKAVASLGLNTHIVGALPLCENMVSGSSYYPCDVIKSYSGKTIEVDNTDAEGRIILADALAYVEKNHKPKQILDFATLTGACVVALGDHATALVSTKKELADSLEETGKKVHQRLWQLPLWDEYKEMIKSDIADVRNTGRPKGHAGTITAAAFLQSHIKDTPWAHFDIAATAWSDEGNTYSPKGGTGWGVRLLVEFLSK